MIDATKAKLLGLVDDWLEYGCPVFEGSIQKHTHFESGESGITIGLHSDLESMIRVLREELK